MNKFKFIFSCVSLILAALTIHSCTKESNVVNDDNTENVSKEDQALAQNIMNFHKVMMAGELQLRSGGDGPSEYTPEVFLKNTEEAINYTYAIPFDKYWDVETRKDTIPITIADCKILTTDGPAKYQQVLNKIICKYTCSDLTNKKLKCVKVSLVSKTCTQLIVEVVSSVGSTDVTASLGEPNPPSSSALLNYKRKFIVDLDAVQGLCSAPFNPNSLFTSAELAKMATWNIIGGYDLAHTLVDVETIFLDSHYTPQTNWWYLQCDDPNYGEPGGCGGWENCTLYYNTGIEGNIEWDNPTALGADLECLTAAELNSILGTTESYCKNQATLANKHFVDVSAYWNWTPCFDKNYCWSGDLILGRKLYRYQLPTNLPTGVCNCTE